MSHRVQVAEILPAALSSGGCAMRKPFFQFVCLLAAVMCCAAATGPAVALDGPVLGEKAPAFRLMDTEGKEHALSGYAGKIVVLLWITRECPYTERILDTKLVQKAIRESHQHDKNVVWLLVNSTAGTSKSARSSSTVLHCSVDSSVGYRLASESV